MSSSAASPPPAAQAPAMLHWVLAGLGLELLVWYTGLGGADLHLVVLPLWLVPAMLCLARHRQAVTGLSTVADRLERLRPSRVYPLLLGLPAVAWSIAFACRYLSFGFGGFDLGIYTSIAFNSAHGHPFFSSVQQILHLGEHFSPVMVLFAPLFRLWPHPAWLLAALLAAYLAVPLLCHRACRLLIGGPYPRTTAYTLALLWLISRPITSAVTFAFHPSTLTPPLILLAWLAIRRQRWLPFLLVLAGLLLFKESLVLVVVGFGLFLAGERQPPDQAGPGPAGRSLARWLRNALPGLLVAAAGLLVGWLLLFQVIPAFRGAAWTGHLSRLGPLADPLPKLWYLVLLLGPLGFLPLRRMRSILLVAPAILLNLATSYPPQYGLRHHYDDVTAALLLVAVLWVLEQHPTDRCRPAPGGGPGRALVPGGAPVVLLALVLLAVQLGEAPLRTARRFWPSAATRAVKAELDELLATLPPQQMIVVQSELDLHVQRWAKVGLQYTDLRHPPAGALVVLAPGLERRPSAELARALQMLRNRRRVFTPVSGCDKLTVYRVRDRRPASNRSIRPAGSGAPSARLLMTRGQGRAIGGGPRLPPEPAGPQGGTRS